MNTKPRAASSDPTNISLDHADRGRGPTRDPDPGSDGYLEVEGLARPLVCGPAARADVGQHVERPLRGYSPSPPPTLLAADGSAHPLAGGWHTAGVVPPVLLPHLRQARDLADRHYADPLDLDALAAAAHVSKYHFCRCFAETYGETPMRYLTRRRIERAQDLLRSANLTVTEVCMLVGFSSLGSFSSRFRELVGETPTRYRDRWAARGGPHIPGCFLFMRGVDALPGAGEQARRSTAPEPAPTLPA